MAKKRTADEIMRELYRDFAGKLPEGGTKEYRPSSGDRFVGREIDVPNGVYRVTGSDWLLQIEGRRFVVAMIATAKNRYGGKDVVHVPTEEPPPPNPGEEHGQKEQAA